MHAKDGYFCNKTTRRLLYHKNMQEQNFATGSCRPASGAKNHKEEMVQ